MLFHKDNIGNYTKYKGKISYEHLTTWVEEHTGIAVGLCFYIIFNSSSLFSIQFQNNIYLFYNFWYFFVDFVYCIFLLSGLTIKLWIIICGIQKKDTRNHWYAFHFKYEELYAFICFYIFGILVPLGISTSFLF